MWLRNWIRFSVIVSLALIMLFVGFLVSASAPFLFDYGLSPIIANGLRGKRVDFNRAGIIQSVFIMLYCQKIKSIGVLYQAFNGLIYDLFFYSIGVKNWHCFHSAAWLQVPGQQRYSDSSVHPGHYP